MVAELRRRDFLKGSAAIGMAAAGGFTCVEIAGAAPIEAPVIGFLPTGTGPDRLAEVLALYLRGSRPGDEERGVPAQDQ